MSRNDRPSAARRKMEAHIAHGAAERLIEAAAHIYRPGAEPVTLDPGAVDRRKSRGSCDVRALIFDAQ